MNSRETGELKSDKLRSLLRVGTGKGTFGAGPSLVRKLKYRLWSLPRAPRELDAALLLLGTFKRIGWIQSIRATAPVDSAGDALPWLTYPAIFWLDRILTGHETVLEVGAGNSTLWFASRASVVTSIEHDQSWYETLRLRVPANVDLQFHPCLGDSFHASSDDPYIAAIRRVQDSSIDLALIDGMARLTCCESVLSKVKEHGLIVLDDSHRREYRVLHDKLNAREYTRIDFVGPVPGASNFSTTSVFSRDFRKWSAREPPVPWGSTIDDFWPSEQSRGRD